MKSQDLAPLKIKYPSSTPYKYGWISWPEGGDNRVQKLKKKVSLYFNFLPLLSPPPPSSQMPPPYNIAVNRCDQPPPLTHPFTDNKGSRCELLPSSPQVFSEKLTPTLVDGVSIHSSTISRQQNQPATLSMPGNTFSLLLLLFLPSACSASACWTGIQSACREQIIINMVAGSSPQPYGSGMDPFHPSPNI